MNPHFGNALADSLAIAKIPELCTNKPGQNSRLRLLVGQTR